MDCPDNAGEEKNISGLLPERNRRREGLRPGGEEVSRRVRQPEFPGIREGLRVVSRCWDFQEIFSELEN